MSVIRLQGETEKRKGLYYKLDSGDEPIGVGGMGQVFKGTCVNEHTGATRPVAIKFMFDDLPPHAIERARREASIQLRNDNLVEMLGFIEIAERTQYGDVKMHYHVVSELLTGVSLSDLMEGKTTDRDGVGVPFAEKLLADYQNDSEHFARTVVMNILSGLMALHDAGYIHRDIDPSNIMITQDGHIKLIDFGIAKQMNTLTTNDKGLTVAGKFLGKPEYAAPELVLGDIRHQNQTTDIYAMGILLYQCIVGHTPFEGPRHEILEQQLKTKLPLSSVHNKQLRKIIAKACEKKQDLRYQTSAQMRVDLEAVTWTAKKSVSPKGPSKPVDKRIIGIVAGAVAALALIGVGIHFMMANPQTEPEITAAVQNEQVAVPQAEPTVEPEATATPEPKEEPKEEPKVEPKQEPKAEPKPEPKAEPKPEPKVEPKAEPKVEPKAEPKPEPKAEPKVTKGNLRYGSWSGKVSGGKPIGIGTLTFTSSATIRCSNGGSINAQAGDKINNAEFDDDGHLYQGTWIKADGTKKTIMP